MWKMQEAMQADGFMDSVEWRLCEEVETVRGFCYLGDRVNAGSGCEAAVTARARSSGNAESC